MRAKAIEQLRLQPLRVKCGLSLRAAAELHGLSPRELNDIELGKVAAPADQVSHMVQRLELALRTGDA